MLWYEQMEQTSSRFAELRDGADQGLWIRAYGQRMTLDSAGVESTSDVFGAQFGRDLRFAKPYGNWYVGLTGGVAEARVTAGNSGTANVYPFNVGLYGGLVGHEGWFFDASAGYLGQSNSLSVAGANANNASYNDNGFSVTLEGGRRITLAGGWTIEPRAGVDYLRANSASYVFDSGMPVELAAHGATIAKLGATLSKTVTFGHTNLQPYVSLNGMHAFSSEQTVTVAALPISAQTPSNWGVVNVGVSGQVNQSGRLALNVSYAKGQQHYQSPVAVTLSFSYRK
jgi:outer membrane autotransporter protein